MRHKKYRKVFEDERINCFRSESLDGSFDILLEAYKIINDQDDNCSHVSIPQRSFKRKLKVFLKALWF